MNEEERGIFEHLEEMGHLAAAGQWASLEQKYLSLCRSLAGPTLADRVMRLDFGKYGESLRAPYLEASAECARRGHPALYFEYDLDNAWEGAFFVCC